MRQSPSGVYLSDNIITFVFLANVVVSACESAAQCRSQPRPTRTLALFDGDYVVAQPQRLEIRLLGTSIRAEGVAGIIGAIALVGLILITYFGN